MRQRVLDCWGVPGALHPDARGHLSLLTVLSSSWHYTTLSKSTLVGRRWPPTARLLGTHIVEDYATISDFRGRGKLRWLRGPQTGFSVSVAFWFLCQLARMSCSPALPSMGAVPMFVREGVGLRHWKGRKKHLMGLLSCFYFFSFFHPCKERMLKPLGLLERFPGCSWQNGCQTDVWSSSKPKPFLSVEVKGTKR